MIIAVSIIVAGALIAAVTYSAIVKSGGGGRGVGTVPALGAYSTVDPGWLHDAVQKRLIRVAHETLKGTVEAAALTQEAYLLDTGTYTDDWAELQAYGLQYSTAVHILIDVTSLRSYCIQAQHADLGSEHAYHFESEVGAVEKGPCPTIGTM